MTSVAAFPYLCPKIDRVRAGPWQMRGASSPDLLPDVLPHWDPSTSIVVARRIEVDLVGVREECQLSKDASFRLVSGWHSPGTSLRGIGTSVVADGDGCSASLEFNIEGRLLAQSVVLNVHLLFWSGKALSALAPRMRGSVLWSHAQSLVLEGYGTRYPVEICDFRSRTWLPENAGWYLDWESEDLSQPVLGGLRLLINSNHPVVCHAVETFSSREKVSSASRAIVSAIYHDVGRVMLLGALANPEFVRNPQQYAEGTIGNAIWRFVRMLYGDEALTIIAHERMTSPFRFECELQERLRIFSQVT